MKSCKFNSNNVISNNLPKYSIMIYQHYCKPIKLINGYVQSMIKLSILFRQQFEIKLEGTAFCIYLI